MSLELTLKAKKGFSAGVEGSVGCRGRYTVVEEKGSSEEQPKGRPAIDACRSEFPRSALLNGKGKSDRTHPHRRREREGGRDDDANGNRLDITGQP